MMKELPEATANSEIIWLDVNRSLNWNQELRITMTYILNLFTYYHAETGYLQGMNYLCEHLLKMTEDQYEVYSMFEHLMNHQYHRMYDHNFHGIKIRIYQFMRLLQQHRPLLHAHFQTENIEGDHFLLPWAVTLWGEMRGDLSFVLLDGFILKGWKWWFKVVLWLLGILEPELLKMNFEEIMQCLSELSNTLFSMKLEELSNFGIDSSGLKF